MDILIAAAAVAGLSVGVVVLFRLSVSYPVAGCAVAAGFGALALALIAYSLTGPNRPGEGLDNAYGAWLGLIAAAGITVGGYLGLQDSSTSGRQAAVH